MAARALGPAAFLLTLCCATLAAAAPAHPWNAKKLNIAPAGQSRDGYIYVPPTYNKARPSPLLIMFHEAGKSAKEALALLDQAQPLLDQTRTIVLLPESRGPTWDVVMTGGQFGPDALYLRTALSRVMQQYNINRKRIALAGFSDGATMAISLLPLGSVASHIIAWSSGGFAPPLVNGQPKVAVFHGVKDQLFPIDKTARPIVQQIAQRLPNSEISYQEHQGAHEATPAVIQQGLEWFLLDKPINPTNFSQKGRPAGAPAARGAAGSASERGGLLSRLG